MGRTPAGGSEPAAGKYRPTMADRPRNDDWWLASDGKWYPPELAPGAEGAVDSGASGQADATGISSALTNAVSILVGVASGLLLVAAFFGFRYATEIGALGDDAALVDRDPTTSEIAFVGWSFLAGVVVIVAAVTSLVWVYSTSKAGDARGATDRRWRGGWTIGSWLIPVANLVLPKLVFNELEKIFQVPFRGVPIEGEWRAEERTQLADLWWALWAASSLVSGASLFISPSDPLTGSAMSTAANVGAMSMLLNAASGVFFVMVVRRIYVFSNR